MDSYALRIELAGEDSKEVFESQLHYSAVLREMGKLEEAEVQLKATLERCRQKFKGPESLFTATVMNNLGHLLKQSGKSYEARPLYMEALKLRSSYLKPGHPDVIVCKHNLAELLLQMGLQEEAGVLQNEILQVQGIDDDDYDDYDDDDDNTEDSDD